MHDKYLPLSIGAFLKNPGKVANTADKERQFVVPADLETFERVETRCPKEGCFLLLRSVDYDNAEDVFSVIEEATEYKDTDGVGSLWIVPTRVQNDGKELAGSLGTVIWDESRHLVMYQALTNIGNDPVNRFFVRDYSKEWNTGQKDWVKMTLPSKYLQITGYDYERGWIAIDEFDSESNELVKQFEFSVEKPAVREVK